MPLFQYRALQADGAMAEGQLEAAGRHEAFRQMEGLGLRPIKLLEKAGGQAQKTQATPSGPGALSLNLGSAKITPRQLENFTRVRSRFPAACQTLYLALA